MTSSHILAVDLGGTKIAAARYDDDLKCEDTKKASTPASDGFSSVIDHVVTFLQELRTPYTRAIGIGIPGLVSKDGVLLHAPNIVASENFPVREHIEKMMGLPVVVENDVGCFALAEAREGAGKGHDVVLGITMGTGVGGGIVISGELYRGAHGFSAEVGHMLLRPGEPPFASKNMRGEVEQFLSGSAMRERCKQAKKPQEYLEGEVCAFMHDDVFREVAWLCVNLTHLLDPSIIVFGGSTGRALKPHLSSIEKELKQWMLPHMPLPSLAIASLGDAATRGAAMLAKQRLQAQT